MKVQTQLKNNSNFTYVTVHNLTYDRLRNLKYKLLHERENMKNSC